MVARQSAARDGSELQPLEPAQRVGRSPDPATAGRRRRAERPGPRFAPAGRTDRQRPGRNQSGQRQPRGDRPAARAHRRHQERQGHLGHRRRPLPGRRAGAVPAQGATRSGHRSSARRARARCPGPGRSDLLHERRSGRAGNRRHLSRLQRRSAALFRRAGQAARSAVGRGADHRGRAGQGDVRQRSQRRTRAGRQVLPAVAARRFRAPDRRRTGAPGARQRRVLQDAGKNAGQAGDPAMAGLPAHARTAIDGTDARQGLSPRLRQPGGPGDRQAAAAHAGRARVGPRAGTGAGPAQRGLCRAADERQ